MVMRRGVEQHMVCADTGEGRSAAGGAAATPAPGAPRGSRTRSPSSANGGLLNSPKLVLHHLPGGVQRKLTEELDVSWRFESSHPFAAPGHQIFLGHCAFRMGHHKGLTHLTESLVGYTDNGDLSDRGMFKHEALDLSRIGVEAANNEHVLFTPVDPQPARLVEIAQVAGV